MVQRNIVDTNGAFDYLGSLSSLNQPVNMGSTANAILIVEQSRVDLEGLLLSSFLT